MSLPTDPNIDFSGGSQKPRRKKRKREQSTSGITPYHPVIANITDDADENLSSPTTPIPKQKRPVSRPHGDEEAEISDESSPSPHDSGSESDQVDISDPKTKSKARARGKPSTQKHTVKDQPAISLKHVSKIKTSITEAAREKFRSSQSVHLPGVMAATTVEGYSAMAGYLNFSTTGQLASLIKRLEPQLQQVFDAESDNWFVPVDAAAAANKRVAATTGKDLDTSKKPRITSAPIQLNTIWKTLIHPQAKQFRSCVRFARNYNKLSMWDQAGSILKDDAKSGFALSKGHVNHAKQALFVVFLVWVVDQNPDIFVETHDFRHSRTSLKDAAMEMTHAQSDVVMYFDKGSTDPSMAFGAEDLHRAYWIYRMWKKNRDKIMTSGIPDNQAPVPMMYFTDADKEPSQKSVVATKSNPWVTSPETDSKIDAFLRHDAIPGEEIAKVVGSRLETEQDSRNRFLRSSINMIDALNENTLPNNLLLSTMAPAPPEYVKATLSAIGADELLTVLFDDPARAQKGIYLDTSAEPIPIDPHISARYNALVQNTVAVAHAIDAAADDDVRLSPADISTDEVPQTTSSGVDSTTAFRPHKDVMVAADSTQLDHPTALQELGFPTSNNQRHQVRMQPVLDADPDSLTSQLELLPWQILTLAFMKKQEEGPVKGGVIANDCGTGKTITCLSHIALSAERQEKAFEEAGKPTSWVFKPTLVVCPNNVVPVWINEIIEYFNGVLELRVWYGKDIDSDAISSERMMSNDPVEALRDFKECCPANDPRSARTILLTSYGTWSRRTLVSKTEMQERKRVREANNVKAQGYFHMNSGEDSNATDDEFTSTLTTAKTARREVRQPADAILDNSDADPDAAFAEAERQLSDIEFLAGDDSNHNSFDRTKVFANIFAYRFDRVILDEGHKAKNSSTATHRSVHTLYADRVWMTTATLQSNRAGDLLGILNLLFRRDRRLPQDKRNADWAMMFEKAAIQGVENAARPNDGEEWPLYFPEGVPAYLLDPKAFASLVNADKLFGQVARNVFDQILPLIQIRLTMATPITAYGKTQRIGDNIPSFDIVTVELQMTMHEEYRYRSYHDTYIGALSRPTGESDGENNVGSRPGVKNLRDQAIHRALSLITSDGRAALFISRTPSSRVTSNQLSRFCDEHRDAGSLLYHGCSRDNPADPPYRERDRMALYLAGNSPKLRMLARLLHKIMFEIDEHLRRKIIIYCNWPAEQWLLEMFLFNCGIPAYSIKSSMLAKVRTATINKFNSATDRVRILLLTVKNTGAGVNLQHCANHMIFFSIPGNYSEIQHCIGRINRLGQKHRQSVFILTIDNSYDQVLMSSLVREFSTTLAGDARLLEVTNAPLHAAAIREALSKDSGNSEQNIDETAINDHYINLQVDAIISQSLGLAYSRLENQQKGYQDMMRRAFFRACDDNRCPPRCTIENLRLNSEEAKKYLKHLQILIENVSLNDPEKAREMSIKLQLLMHMSTPPPPGYGAQYFDDTHQDNTSDEGHPILPEAPSAEELQSEKRKADEEAPDTPLKKLTRTRI